jgi:hypothetical protein
MLIVAQCTLQRVGLMTVYGTLRGSLLRAWRGCLLRAWPGCLLLAC